MPTASCVLRGLRTRGLARAGSWFRDGWTPLGRFRVNGILSDDRFEMDPDLIAASGRSEAELRSSLFRDMSSIDFKGDGRTAEYGIGHISLEPVLRRLSLFHSIPMTAGFAGTALPFTAPMTKAELVNL